MGKTDWTSIVNRYGPLVWRTAWRLLGDGEDVADCFQETFIAAVGVQRGGRIRSFPALLSRLATARALDQLRRRFRQRRQVQNLDDWSGVALLDPDPAALAQATELAGRVQEALGHLPAQQAEALCLRALSELSYRQIAGEMGIKSGAARVMVHRARGRLAQLLGESAKAKSR